MSISGLVRYRNDSFHFDIFSSDIGITVSMSDIAVIKIDVDAHQCFSQKFLQKLCLNIRKL